MGRSWNGVGRLVLVLALALVTMSLSSGAEAEPAGGPGLTGLDIVGWGDDHEGQADSPSMPNGVSVVDVAAGMNLSAALLSDGTVRVWGQGVISPVPASLSGRRVVAIAAGAWDVMALTSDGKVTTWGVDTLLGHLTVPAELDDDDVVAISMKKDHALALTSQGRVVAWGDDTYGQTDVPDSLAGTRVKAISAGLDNSLALTEDGHIVGWGGNEYVEAEPPPESSGVTFSAVSAGIPNAAITSSGRVVTWGAGPFTVPLPQALMGQTIVSISAGAARTLAVDTHGTLYCWGYDWDTEPDFAIPAAVQGRTVTAISMSLGYTALVATLGQFAGTGVGVTGTAQVGQTLTATPRTTPDPDSTAIQWLRDGVPISGATGPSYALAPADAGARIRAEVTLRRAQYDAARVTSEPTSLVATADMPGSVTASLAGSAVVGSTLRAGATSLGLPAGATTGLQWRRDGVLTPAKGATYVLTLADRGHRMSVTSTVRAPGFTDLVTTTKDTAVVRLPGLTFAVHSSVSRQRRGGTVVVGARGLVAGETYRVTLAGRSLATGTASSNGKVSRGVTIPRGTPLGRQRLVLTGAQSDRSGSRLIQVLRRG